MIAEIPTGFEMFWSVWPRNSGRYSRKGAKAACLKVWTKNYNETQADLICKHVAWMSHTEAWLRDNGAYIPAPLVYLNQQRWDGADIPTPDAEPMPEATPEIRRTNQWLQAQAQNMAAPNNEAAVASARERLSATRRALKGAA